MKNILKSKHLYYLFISVNCLLILLMLRHYCKDSYSIISFKINNGYTIDIRTIWNWEISKSIYCKVTNDGEIFFPLYMIGNTVEKIKTLKFQIVENKHSNVFAIIENSSPDIVLAIFDFKKQEYWPFQTTQALKSSYAQGKELLNKINWNQIKKYKLSIDVSGKASLKVTP